MPIVPVHLLSQLELEKQDHIVALLIISATMKSKKTSADLPEKNSTIGSYAGPDNDLMIYGFYHYRLHAGKTYISTS